MSEHAHPRRRRNLKSCKVPVHAMSEHVQRTAALIAGTGYAAIFLLAIFANFFVLAKLHVPGDAAATAINIAHSTGLLRAGIVAFLIVFAIDVLIAWALYILFRPTDPSVSLLSAWLRLLYTAFLGVATIPLILAARAVGGGYKTASQEGMILLLVDAFNVAWLVGLILFGLHLMLLGHLLIIGRGPRLLANLLKIAGGLYILDTLAHVVMADYAAYADSFLLIVAVPAVIAELGLTVWLLRRGLKG